LQYWGTKIKQLAINKGREAKKFVDCNPINLKIENIRKLKDWIISAQYYIKHMEKITSVDIRQFLGVKTKGRRKNNEENLDA